MLNTYVLHLHRIFHVHSQRSIQLQGLQCSTCAFYLITEYIMKPPSSCSPVKQTRKQVKIGKRQNIHIGIREPPCPTKSYLFKIAIRSLKYVHHPTTTTTHSIKSTQVCKKQVPVQFRPFPSYPLLQEQLCDPIVLLHIAFPWQLCSLVTHSSMS